jgi:hypothetical protein
MSETATAMRCEAARFDPDAVTVPVAELRPTDLVWDGAGDLHRLDEVRAGLDGSVWVTRHDLHVVEHLHGVVTVHRDGAGRGGSVVAA